MLKYQRHSAFAGLFLFHFEIWLFDGAMEVDRIAFAIFNIARWPKVAQLQRIFNGISVVFVYMTIDYDVCNSNLDKIRAAENSS